MKPASFSRQKIVYFLLILLIAAATFVFFKHYFYPDIPEFAVNIGAAILGSLFTVIITMFLLNTQTEVEFMKDRDLMVYDRKIELYNNLITQVKEILIKQKIERNDLISIQLLNHQLSFIADRKVLESFAAFAEMLMEVAEDGKITDTEQNALLKCLSDLSIQVRYDLSNASQKQAFRPEEIKNLVEQNVYALSNAKTTKEEFLKHCHKDDLPAFEDILKYLEIKNVKVTWGTRGFAIKNSNEKSAARLYSRSSYRNIEVVKESLDRERLDNLVAFLSGHVKGRSFSPDRPVTFRADELPVEKYRELLELLL